MAVYKDEERGTWYCSLYYTDWTGARKLKKKRGFATKRDALAWERKFLEMQQADLKMSFGSFWEIYKGDMQVRLRENTMQTKKHIVETKLLPYFENLMMDEITAVTIRKWQNKLLQEGYKETYLKTVNNQLSAMFNYAVNYYGLKSNPCRKAGSIGKKHADEMQFWTKEEFDEFIKGVSDKPQSYASFMVLFWTGMREGELLALTYENVDFDKHTISIKQSYQRLNGRDVITAPKTPRSVRVISIPTFLVEVLKKYTDSLYGLQPKDRIFPFTKYFFSREMMRGCKSTGVKKIRVHDLRHSHATMLIEMGIPILEVRDRLGHERVETTLNLYGHIYPDKQKELADKLDNAYKK